MSETLFALINRIGGRVRKSIGSEPYATTARVLLDNDNQSALECDAGNNLIAGRSGQVLVDSQGNLLPNLNPAPGYGTTAGTSAQGNDARFSQVRAFTPDQVTGLQCWLAGSDLATIADGTAVTTWPDRSGNGYAAAVAYDSGGTAALKATAYDGRAVLRFLTDATNSTNSAVGTAVLGNQYLSFPSGLSVNGNACSVYVVSTARDGTYFTWDYVASGSTTANGASWQQGGGPSTVTFTLGNTKTVPANFATSRHQFGVQGFRADATGIRYFYNNAYGQKYCAGGAFNATLTNWRFGKQAANNSGYLDGDIAEIIVFNRALTDDEHARMLAYCARQEQIRQIICDGDSLTFGAISSSNSFNIPLQWGYSWPWQMSRIIGDAAGSRVLNYAVPGVGVNSGGTSPTARLSSLAGLCDGINFPGGNIYVLSIGSNDVVSGTSAATIYAIILNCHTTMRAAGFKTIAVSVADRADNTTATRAVRNALNALMKNAGLALCDAYVDLEQTPLGGDGAYTNATYFNASDSPLIHWTKAGYEVEARAVLAAINKLSAPASVTPAVLSTTPGISAATVANTAIFTVPPGKTCVVTGYNVRVMAASGVTAPASAGLGTTAGTSNVSAAQTLTGTTAVNASFLYSITGASIVAPAGSTIYFNLTAAASGTSETLAVDLLGYLY